jgi:hypothetical protein
MVTCQRNQQSDHITVCYSSGLCTPSYFAATGHFIRPQCQSEADAQLDPPEVVPDYFVTLEQIRQLQDLFAAQMLKAPPMDRDWAIAEHRARWWAAIREDREIDSDRFPEPTGAVTEREVLLAKYLEAFKKLHIQTIPDEVFRLFYFQPRLYLQRLPDGHREGLVFYANSIMTVNMDFVNIPSAAAIPDPPGPAPVMNDTNFPVLGAPTRYRTPTEFQTNPIRETYALTTQRIAELIRAIFANQPEKQIQPSAEDVEALYSP